MAAKQAHPLMQDCVTGLSPMAAGLLRTATVALDGLDPKTADVALASVLALAPDCAEAWRMQGVVRHLRGDYAGAVTLLRRAHALAPADAMVQMNLATALYAGGEFAAAVPYLQRACALAPDFAPVWFNLGKVYMLQGRPAGAITALHRALDVDPDHVPARILLAQAETALGMLTQASANYREVLRCEPGQPIAWGGLADLDAERLSKDDVVQLRKVLQRPDATHPARVALGFALAKALENQADYDGAFRALNKAKALQHRQLNLEPRDGKCPGGCVPRRFRQTLARSVGSSAGRAGDLHRGTAAVRLDADRADPGHPFADDSCWRPDRPAAGHQRGVETSRATLAAMGEDGDGGRLVAAEAGLSCAHRVLAPTQTLLHRPQPAKLATGGRGAGDAAGARVVNSRRDAFENCFACYRQLFASGNEFSYGLDPMVSYWRDYDRLSRHWLRLFPTRFVDHGYEAWQADPEVRVRRLLDFCGPAFDPACVAFHRKQNASSMSAGQLLRRDSERAALYGKNLDRLRALLGSGNTPA
jgi:predicted Zn-dependent protease